ncbi:zinc finger BED domain-containing protein RICESLEEPER 2-like [Panicum virgatum]|uniref:zinc finger BED domain-containing protein RICESLEEPER 2-like n=1 Tax=Panicum virgatum TaxID=38727 RepID=UPI0019D6790F|nr:zinc finger BED domain-containing protein RICESLEEPER 2-like [Panicum virgatum]
MAGSDEETVEVGMNEEWQLCGLARDDDEDNMDEDHEALFGATSNDVIPIDGELVEEEEPSAADGNSAKHPRPSTSAVWADYEKLFKEINGKMVKEDVLGLVLIDVSHNGQNIADRVASVLVGYGLSEKVFAVTLDNASSNASAIHKLKPILSKYLGLEVFDESEYASSSFNNASSSAVNSKFLHHRCACHILNLIVKEALTTLKPLIETFRTAISFLSSSNQRIAVYKSYCIATSVRPRKFQLDMEVRWNSTYLMLKHLFPHKSPFSTFIQAQYPRDEGESLLLTEDHWMMAQKVLLFLELFYDATVTLSGVYYPISPLMIHYLVKISLHLKNYANDVHIRSVVQPMIDKYNKYWRDISLLYCFAFILDPRAKMKGFTRVLRRLGGLTSTDYSAYLVGTRAGLADVYNKYDEKYGVVRLRRTDPPVLSGNSRSAGDEIYDDDGGGPILGGILPGNPNMSRDTSATSLLHAVRSSASNASELVSYLDCDTINHLTDDFNILDWIIEERRRSLKPEVVEMLTCIKEWEAAEARLQQNVEDKELEEAFEELYLDS